MFLSNGFSEPTKNTTYKINYPLLIVDDSTKVTLKDIDSDKPINLGSLTKLMIAEIVLNKIADGNLKLDQKVTITKDIWQRGGAPSGAFSMFTKPNTQVSILDLLRGLIIDNATDAALALSESVSGNDIDFIALMNKRAQELHLNKTHFANVIETSNSQEVSTGTLKDIMDLFTYIINNHPTYLKIASEKTFTWNNITQYNINFLQRNIHSSFNAVAGIVASSKQDGNITLACVEKDGHRVFIAIVTPGSKSSNRSLTNKWLEWAYNNFNLLLICDKNKEVIKLPVYAGTEAEVGAKSSENLYGLVSNEESDFTKIKLIYKVPLIAPIQKGVIIGKVQIISHDKVASENNLIAAKDIQSTSFFNKFKVSIYQATIGWLVDIIYYRFS